jgi:PLP dependent protein
MLVRVRMSEGVFENSFNTIRDRIAVAARAAGRAADTVQLLAASKSVAPRAIRAAYAAGQYVFGENRVQEACIKMAALADLRAHLEWHFIGALQRNKTRWVATAFDWAHAVDRIEIAERLSAQRPIDAPPLNICLQINISGETGKSGIMPAHAARFAHALIQLPRLRLRGLMAIPALSATASEQRAPYRQLRQLFDQLRADGLELDTLSAGMSLDLEAAILEGATLVRIGTALFGARTTGAYTP